MRVERTRTGLMCCLTKAYMGRRNGVYQLRLLLRVNYVTVSLIMIAMVDMNVSEELIRSLNTE